MCIELTAVLFWELAEAPDRLHVEHVRRDSLRPV